MAFSAWVGSNVDNMPSLPWGSMLTPPLAVVCDFVRWTMLVVRPPVCACMCVYVCVLHLGVLIGTGMYMSMLMHRCDVELAGCVRGLVGVSQWAMPRALSACCVVCVDLQHAL